MASDPNQEIKKNEVEARQGTSRQRVIYVLGISTTLIIVLFAIVWATTRH